MAIGGGGGWKGAKPGVAKKPGGPVIGGHKPAAPKGWVAPKPGGAAPGGAPVIGGHKAGHKFIAPTPAHNITLVPKFFVIMHKRFGIDFQIKADLANNQVRYKQWVKGHYSYNGKVQKHNLGANQLDKNNYHEDVNTDGAKPQLYGDWANQQVGLSVYQAKPGGKYLFIGNDTPSDPLNAPIGTQVEISLTFKGQIIDKNPPHNVYDQRIWHVKGKAKI